MFKTLGLLAACAVLAACATVAPKTPAQTVFAIEGDYAAAVTLAVQYKALPACGGGAPVLCSDRATVARIQKADDVTWDAIVAAETAVRTGASAATILQLDEVALKALGSLQTIVSTLKVK